MRFSFPITKTEKTDDGRLLIEGVATSEALDAQGDILDYEGSKKAFEKWRGNLREAHDPTKPVGKALEVMPDDVSKAIAVRAFVSAGAKDTQEKVLDGTLAMFSVGGDAPKRTRTEKVGGKTARRVLEWDMVELSLVDVGANPDAGFALAKGAVASDAIAEAAEAVVEECVKAEHVCPKCGGAMKADELEEKPAEETAKAAEPEPESAEHEAEEHAAQAAWDVRMGLDCLAGLEALRATEAYEVEEGIPEPPEQVRLLDAAVLALRAFIASEAKELVGAPAEKSRGVVIIKTETTVDLDALAAKVAALIPIQKSAAPAAPEPDPRIESILKTVGEVKADIGDLKAIREGVDKILDQPVPGRTPLRMLVPETVSKSVSNATQRVKVLEELAVRADAVSRPAIERELAFARAEIGA